MRTLSDEQARGVLFRRSIRSYCTAMLNSILPIMLSSIFVQGSKSFSSFISSSITKSSVPSRISRIFSAGAMSDHITLPTYGHPNFGITRELPGIPFEKAVEDTKAALKKSGFGVVTEIDMKATSK